MTISESFPRLGAIVKLQKAAISFVVSLCPSVLPCNGRTLLSLDGLSKRLIFGCFSRNRPENSNFVKIG